MFDSQQLLTEVKQQKENRERKEEKKILSITVPFLAAKDCAHAIGA
jgi:hypothetical protein